MQAPLPFIALAALTLTTASSSAVSMLFERDVGSGLEVDGIFNFDTIPSNSSTDLVNGLSFEILDGSAHAASAPISKLTDGLAQLNNDHLNESWLGADPIDEPIRIQVDLTTSVNISQINSYSWHANARSPQIYSVYGASSPSNSSPDFSAAAFQDDAALSTLGYTLIGTVDTGAYGQGGQIGVSFTGDIGSHQYILFDIKSPPGGGGAGRGTFFGEIDVVAVPEPGSLALLALSSLFAIRRRRT